MKPLIVALLSAASLAAAAAPRDRLAEAVQRWSAVARDTTSAVELTRDTRQFTRPVMAGAESALHSGRRLLALYRLAFAWPNLSGADYVAEQTAAGHADSAGLESEWRRMGEALAGSFAPPPPSARERLRPAAVRAFAEAALPQIRIYHEASLDYGRSTGAESGLFYLGSAQAQREFVAFAGTLSEARVGAAPAVRAIGPELDALEHELLVAYRPPASINRHRDFIIASSAIKEARDLEALGLHHGALLRYLLAAMRTGVLRRGVEARESAPIATQIAALGARLGAGVDHSIARFFLETAAADLSLADSSHTTALAIAEDVLPRYLAALSPVKPTPARPAATVTVTLVRWPYT